MTAGEALVRETWRRWNAGERAVDPERFDPEIEIHSALTGTSWQGEAGVLAWQREIDEQFEQWEITAVEVEPVGDERFLVRGKIRARGRGSGMDLDQPASWLVEMRAGRISRVHNFIGHDSAAAAEAEAARGEAP